MNKLLRFLFLTSLILSQSLFASADDLRVFFRRDKSQLDLTYMDNGKRLSEFVSQIDFILSSQSMVLDSIRIQAAASPEGDEAYNLRLSSRRAKALEDYLRANVKDAQNIHFSVTYIGEDWDGLKVELQGSGFENKDDLIGIIDSLDKTLERESALKSRGVWNRMDGQLFGGLRASTAHIFFHELTKMEPQVPSVQVIEQPQPLAPAAPSVILEPEEKPIPVKETESPSRRQRSFLMAVKTNLLYDAASLLNVGVEFPLSSRISLGADYIFPWWQLRSQDITIQMLEGVVTGKYWLGDRKGREALTGLFVGVHAGGGYFDFQLGGDGVQGEFFIMGGVSVGYAHRIARNLHMEYSAGIGYVSLDYRKYYPAKNTEYGDIKVHHYPWQDKRFRGMIPTHLNVSLVWMLGNKKGGLR